MEGPLQNLLLTAIDALMAVIPRSVPRMAALENCRLVSHRGQHDGVHVRENTLQAFADASAAGVWGIECDIRWSADGEPVICHDPDLARVFGRQIRVAETSARELTRLAPAVPSLAAVIDGFAGRSHLMLELKSGGGTRNAFRRDSLRRLLDALEPARDFHILALEPELFDLVDFLPPAACLPVATTNTRAMSRLALERHYAGVAGHFLLVDETMHGRHRAAGQQVGTGFPTSRNCLLREINRGVGWVFSNHAVQLQTMLSQLVSGKQT